MGTYLKEKAKLLLVAPVVLLLAIALAAFVSIAFTGCGPMPAPTAVQATEAAQKQSMENALQDVGIPNIRYFVERKTIARWAEYWDKPSVATYVYCVSFGRVMGYYVCNGKPASTRSYLTPETRMERADLGEGYGDMLVEAPDIDGCYGDNNPGIRGFTASGVPFEWGGDGASWFILGAPLPFDVPCYGK